MIDTISFGVSALGTVMLSMLYGRLRNVHAENRLSRHRSGTPGLADQLIYAAVVDDGIIVGKNGALMAAWAFRGKDNASSSEVEREMVSFRINQALRGLGNGWMVHVDEVRRPAPGYPGASLSHFLDPVSSAIDEERRRLFERMGVLYEGHFVLTLTYLPPLQAQSRFVEMMFDDDAAPADSKARTNNLINFFKRECINVESRLSAALKLLRLGGQKFTDEYGITTTHDSFLAWLQQCISGNAHPVALPNNPIYLDLLLGGQELHGGVVPKIGEKFMQVVAIDGFPAESTPGMLTALSDLPCEYRWSSRFIFLDGHVAVSHLDKYRKKWRQKIRGFFDQVFNTNTGPVDQDAQAMVADAEQAIAEINSDNVAFGYYTSVVVLLHEDRDQLATYARQVSKAIDRLGFTSRIETINTMDAYLGSLPGHGVENVRRPLINSMNLADLLPTSSIWTGLSYAPCPLYPAGAPALMQCVTQGATPFHLNLHVRDLGHVIIFGPTRAGKSTLLGMIAAQLRRYEDMTIFFFEKGMSAYPLAKAVGAKHFRVAGDDDRLTFCPLQFLATKGDRAWAMEWIETLLVLNGVKVTPLQRNEIASAILNMHASGARTLSEFSVTIQDESIREALKQYTIDGSMGQLLDAEEDGLLLADFTVFEIEDLMNLGEKYALPVLLYLFRRVERSLQGQPAAIILDEAWLMLAHPVFREKIHIWLNTLAKTNCAVIMATQNISAATQSGIFDVMMEATAAKILLPNKNARLEDSAAMYKRMGLNNKQIEIIATAIPKKDYYFLSEQGQRLFELALGPLAKAFVGATDKESVHAIQALEAKHGDGWIDAWLASRGLDLNDYKGQP